MRFLERHAFSSGAKSGGHGRLPVLLIVLLLLSGGLAAWVGVSGTLHGPPPSQQRIGRWRIAELGTHGGPWIFDLDETSLAITTPEGVRTRFGIVRTVTDPTHVQVALTPPHPVLGACITLIGDRRLSVIARDAQGIGIPEP